MPRYRHQLPQLSGDLFVTDGGLETSLVFLDGFELPAFAAFVLLETEQGRDALRRYYRGYADLARQYQAGLILEGMTWRASRDWGRRLGYTPEQIGELNRQGMALLADLRREYEAVVPQIAISGCLGPRGDGYRVDALMDADQAADYHREQIAALRESEADLVSALTIPYIAEAIGIAQAAQAEQMPVVISFTVETDGRLPSGETLQDAIDQVDRATSAAPAYYMINCAHPTHFAHVLNGAPWTNRIRAIRANASSKSHAELDEATELDAGDPQALGAQYRDLSGRLSNLSVLGGCCGTDHRHVAAICQALAG